MENRVITVPDGIIKKQTDEALKAKMTDPEVALMKAREDALKNIADAVEASSIVNTDSTKHNNFVTVDFSEKAKSTGLKEIPLYPVVSLMENTSQEVLSTVATQSAPKSNIDRMYAASAIETTTTQSVSNANPNGAYTINFETYYNDSIAAKGDQRWYNFQITEKKKLTVYMSPVADATVDNDLYLFKLNTTTYQLEAVSQSKNNADIYELLSYIADPGIYYVCVSAYAGTAANTFGLLARVTDKWDAYEADDSMSLATEQVLGKIVKRTLDNSIDQDCSIWLVSAVGNYYIKFFGVPDKCNYQIQILSSDQKLLTTVPKNTAQVFTNVAQGGYFIRVLAPDGVVDPTAEYGVVLVDIPAEITNFDDGYTLWVTEDGTHFVERMQPEGKTAVLFIDRQHFDIYTKLNIKTGRAIGTGTHNCSGRVSSDSFIGGLAMGRYVGSTLFPNGLKNALAICANGYYSSYHCIRTYNPSDLAGASSYITGTDEFHMTYYQGYWSWISPNPVTLTFIVNLDTGEVADLLYQNWFYGINDLDGYGAYSWKESPVLIITGDSLLGEVRDCNNKMMSIK
ncbi:MAG: hypothetical protein K0Q53_412 [Massilibacillus sp.]|nr:hypothetical protein [Massilibacillus sp.]